MKSSDYKDIFSVAILLFRIENLSHKMNNMKIKKGDFEGWLDNKGIIITLIYTDIIKIIQDHLEDNIEFQYNTQLSLSWKIFLMLKNPF